MLYDLKDRFPISLNQKDWARVLSSAAHALASIRKEKPEQRQQLVELLLCSFSISAKEKRRVLRECLKLSTTRMKMLEEVFEDERKQFNQLLIQEILAITKALRRSFQKHQSLVAHGYELWKFGLTIKDICQYSPQQDNLYHLRYAQSHRESDSIFKKRLSLMVQDSLCCLQRQLLEAQQLKPIQNTAVLIEQLGQKIWYSEQAPPTALLKKIYQLQGHYQTIEKIRYKEAPSTLQGMLNDPLFCDAKQVQ